jgi:DNA polymerase-3 subunit delta
MDAGSRNASEAVASARPPVFAQRRRLIEQALHALDGDALARFSERVRTLTLQTRRTPGLAEAATRLSLLAMSAEIRRRIR